MGLAAFVLEQTPVVHLYILDDSSSIHKGNARLQDWLAIWYYVVQSHNAKSLQRVIETVHLVRKEPLAYVFVARGLLCVLIVLFVVLVLSSFVPDNSVKFVLVELYDLVLGELALLRVEHLNRFGVLLNGQWVLRIY